MPPADTLSAERTAQAVEPQLRRRGPLDNLNRMHDEASAVDIHHSGLSRAVEIHPPHIRLWHGMRRPANWLQLVRFGVVGGIGFVVNIAVYTGCVHGIGLDYHVAAVAAWLVAVANNFVLNRHWTFDARDHGRASFQAARFLTVSLVALACSLLLLIVFVELAGLPKVPAQALAVAASMPLNFLGNKLWSFRREGEAAAPTGL
jgi:putative flippase GtrA